MLKYLDDTHSGFINKAKFKELQEKDDRQLLEISYTSLVDPVKEGDDEASSGGRKKKGKKETIDDKVPARSTVDRGVEIKPRLAVPISDHASVHFPQYSWCTCTVKCCRHH